MIFIGIIILFLNGNYIHYTNAVFMKHIHLYVLYGNYKLIGVILFKAY